MLVGVNWERGHGHDIHVVRGRSSVALWSGLLLEPEDGDPVHVDAGQEFWPPGTRSVIFVPLLRNAVLVGGTYTAFGISVRQQTGQVTVPAGPPPARTVDNFIIEARAERTDNEVFTARIRIHVHDRLDRAWLTPSMLSLRMGVLQKDGNAFSVLASFTDGTVGDISFDHEITYRTGSGDEVSPVELNASTGFMAGRRPTATSQPETIVALFQNSLVGTPVGGDPTGQVNVLHPWSDVDVRFIGGAGKKFADQVPNILILGDGFQPGQGRDFHELAVQLVRRLWDSRSAWPFGRLSRSMNFWAAFSPSREYGISTLPELQEVQTNAGLRGIRLPIPRAPAPNGAYSLAELVHLVGLPTRDRATKTEAELLDHWTAVYPDVVRNRITAPMIRRWKELATRGLANEHDTAFGLANGHKPASAAEERLDAPLFHPRRGRRSTIDLLVAALVHPDVPGIGDRWKSTPEASPGKDRDRIVVLCAGAVMGGNATINSDDPTRTDLIAVGVSTARTIQIGHIGTTRQLEATGRRLPPRVGGVVRPGAEAVYITAHEIAHSFGLGDEYGNDAGALPSSVRPKTLSSFNLYLRPDPPAPPAPDPPLNADGVPWRWPRLAKAATLTGPPERVDTTNRYRLRMPPLHLRFFKAGEVARLRAPLSGRRVSDPVTVRSTGADGRGDFLEVENPSGTLAGQVGDFQANSVLCIPVPAPGGGDPWAELMARRVRLHINASRGPLNAPAGNADRACRPGPDPFYDQASTNWPAPDHRPPVPPADPTWIVGMYEGGSTVACRVYHPTNRCMMRVGGYRFCLVCRYVLIDLIDARWHRVLEKLIRDENLYPPPP